MPTRLAFAAVLLVPLAGAALQVHEGDLLVTDSANARVLLVDPATGVVTPFSPRPGSGQSYLFAPAGIAIDPAGTIFVVDSFADHVIAIDPATGAQSVLHDYSIQFGDFGPSDVGSGPQGIALEQTVTGLDHRDLYVASSDGLHQVHREADATYSELLSGANELLDGEDVAVQEEVGQVYALWVVAYGVLVRYFVDGTPLQTLTETDARTVDGVDRYDTTVLFSRADSCGYPGPFNGLFRWDGAPGGTQVGRIGYAACLSRALAIASPTLVYATYGGTQIVELAPAIEDYVGHVVATIPDGDVAPVVADLAVSPATFPAPEPAPAALGAGAIASLLAFARRRRIAALLVLLPATAFASGRQVMQGDILLTAGVVYHVSHADGLVSVLTPRAGSGPNLLLNPRGISVNPDGEVLVVDTGRVLSIDPATGAQFVVQDGLDPIDLGFSPQGVAANPRDPQLGFFRSVFVASHGELLRIDRGGFSASVSQVSPYPQSWENYLGERVVAHDPGSGGVDVWVSNFRGVLAYDGDQDVMTALYTEPTGSLAGFDLSPSQQPYVTRVAATCPSNDNGVYSYDFLYLTVFPFATGGDLGCPLGMAFEPVDVSPFEIVVIDGRAQPFHLVRVTLGALEEPIVEPFATLPNGVYASDLAIAPVTLPEPTETSLAATTFLALLLGAARSHLVPRHA
jgi:DNA-binding beta-propeller fold protein YncE